MLSSKLTRWAGLALLLAGVLIAVPVVLHPDETAEPSTLLTNSWLIIHSIFIVGNVLSILGLMGLYARHAQALGRGGLMGFILITIGNALFVGVLMIDSYVVPALAADIKTQPLLDEAGPLFGGPLGLVFMISGLIFSLGAILTGLTIMRTSVLPRWAGLFLLGGPLLAFTPPLPHLAGVVGGALMGISFVWLGYALWSGLPEPTRQFKQVTAS
jgi:hypothetical protein